MDAYHKWLGVPPEEQPPNHYRLLGINQYEGAARADVPAPLDRVFRKMLAKDPAARYQFMGDLLADLDQPKRVSVLSRLLALLRRG